MDFSVVEMNEEGEDCGYYSRDEGKCEASTGVLSSKGASSETLKRSSPSLKINILRRKTQ
jgi:hypothetical protein